MGSGQQIHLWKQWVVRCFALLALIACATDPAATAELAIVDPEPNDQSRFNFEPHCNLRLVNGIEPGDYEKAVEKLSEFAARPDVKNYDGITDDRGGWQKMSRFSLCLASPGGDLAEAFKISKLFEQWIMVVEAGDSCVSACAMLFMSGGRRDKVLRYDVARSGRYLHHQGSLGFHAPALTVTPGPNQTLEPAEVAKAYNRAINTMGKVLFPFQFGDKTNFRGTADQQRDTSFVGFSSRAEVDEDYLPVDLLMAFVSVAPSEVYWAKMAEAKAWGIEIFGLPPPKVLTKRMLTVACMDNIRSRCLKAAKPGVCFHKDERNRAVSLDFGHDSIRDESWRDGTLKDVDKFHILRAKSLPIPSGGAGVVEARSFQIISNDRAHALAEVKQGKEAGTSKRRLWCEVLAVWRKNELSGLYIFSDLDKQVDRDEVSISGKSATFWSQEKPKLLFREREPFDPRKLPLWKLLPAGMILDDIGKLGGQYGWGWLEEGGNFFDKPTNLGAP